MVRQCQEGNLNLPDSSGMWPRNEGTGRHPQSQQPLRARCLALQLRGERATHLGEILLQELQHVVHGALAVLSGGDTQHCLAVHSHVAGLHTQPGHADGVSHRLRVHL